MLVFFTVSCNSKRAATAPVTAPIISCFSLAACVSLLLISVYSCTVGAAESTHYTLYYLPLTLHQTTHDTSQDKLHDIYSCQLISQTHMIHRYAHVHNRVTHTRPDNVSLHIASMHAMLASPALCSRVTRGVALEYLARWLRPTETLSA